MAYYDYGSTAVVPWLLPPNISMLQQQYLAPQGDLFVASLCSSGRE